jgi:hypothetical protein
MKFGVKITALRQQFLCKVFQSIVGHLSAVGCKDNGKEIKSNVLKTFCNFYFQNNVHTAAQCSQREYVLRRWIRRRACALETIADDVLFIVPGREATKVPLLLTVENTAEIVIHG